MILSMIVTTIIQTSELYLVDAASWESSQAQTYVAGVCGEASKGLLAKVCMFSWHWKDCSLGAIVTLVMYSVGMTTMMRPEMRGAAFRLALDRSRTRWLKRRVPMCCVMDSCRS